ncbi:MULTISPECIES: hypothetical protein [unclassified Rathayibacter]|uniref:hypothetical protein n=1 Tax=unclassified Rathayibacter TaxID=2609250 RepID=UPI000CE7A88F|nr:MULTISPECIES: hypothetical protein [unclassified Rathayibacter]PPG52132.1 hypothetical protein C5C24_05360 [Rathayibacter sp. AY2B3]PPI25098.1 hypothetical protein C5D44_11595 [Rathayibacter sp. AY1B5]
MSSPILDALSAPPARRDVASIRGALAEVAIGDSVRVLVRSPRYGLYGIEGVVRQAVGGELVVADVFLGTGTEIQSIALAPDADEVGGERSAEGLEHGDPVRVAFSTPALGSFTITGPLTAGGRDGFLLVGSWIAADGGEPGRHVDRIERLTDVGVHEKHVPGRRSAVEE